MSAPTEEVPALPEWTVRPIEGRGLAGLFAVLIIVLFGVFVALLAGDWIWGVLAVVLLFATVSRFFLTSRIRISAQGIVAEFPLITRRASWKQIVWIRHDEQSALIRTTRRRFRGREFTILFGQDPHCAIALLEEHVPPGLLSRVTGETSES